MRKSFFRLILEFILGGAVIMLTTYIFDIMFMLYSKAHLIKTHYINEINSLQYIKIDHKNDHFITRSFSKMLLTYL